jgi:hypothetical protein
VTDDLTARLDAIRGRERAARPAPWRLANDNEGSEYLPFWVMTDPSAADDADWFAEIHVGDEATGQFIAEARTDVPALLAAVDAVLALAAGSAVSVRGTPADCTVACVIGDCNCSGAGEPVAWTLDPAAIRSAVAAALAAEGGTDDG